MGEIAGRRIESSECELEGEREHEESGINLNHLSQTARIRCVNVIYSPICNKPMCLLSDLN